MNVRALLLSALILLPGIALSFASPQQQPATPVRIFEIELPELGAPPTASAELIIPSTHLTTIVLHVLNPHADRIDYGQIFTFLNGEATSTISEILPTQKGKLLRLDLKRRPGFDLIPGRNTVEIRAEDRMHRVFYSSFILRTATENRNQDFSYSAQLAGDFLGTPPDLVMLEPEHVIIVPSPRASIPVRFSGMATAATSVKQILIDGVAATLKRTSEGRRRLGLAHEENQVTFELIHTVRASAENVKVEAVDTAGNRATLNIPVLGQTQPAGVFKGKKYALVIGISSFLNNGRGIPNLRFADRDARSIYDFLQSAAGGKFSPENTLMLLNESATLKAVKDALNNFIVRPGPDDLLLLFIATHGSPDPYNPQDLYFLMHDTDVDRMPATALAMRDFETAIKQKVVAKRAVMLFDACHSAGLAGPGGETARGGNNLVNLYLEKSLYRQEGRAVITSSDVTESSFEAERWGGGHGVFTHFLLDGLSGKADENLDGLVTVGEIFRFVRQKVRTETQFRQNPLMLAGAGENLALSAVSSRVSKR